MSDPNYKTASMCHKIKTKKKRKHLSLTCGEFLNYFQKCTAFEICLTFALTCSATLKCQVILVVSSTPATRVVAVNQRCTAGYSRQQQEQSSIFCYVNFDDSIDYLVRSLQSCSVWNCFIMSLLCCQLCLKFKHSQKHMLLNEWRILQAPFKMYKLRLLIKQAYFL